MSLSSPPHPFLPVMFFTVWMNFWLGWNQWFFSSTSGLEACTVSSNFMSGVLRFNITLSLIFTTDKRLRLASLFHYLTQDTFLKKVWFLLNRKCGFWNMRSFLITHVGHLKLKISVYTYCVHSPKLGVLLAYRQVLSFYLLFLWSIYFLNKLINA